MVCKLIGYTTRAVVFNFGIFDTLSEALDKAKIVLIHGNYDNSGRAAPLLDGKVNPEFYKDFKETGDPDIDCKAVVYVDIKSASITNELLLSFDKKIAHRIHHSTRLNTMTDDEIIAQIRGWQERIKQV